jgi:hypothetical protein
MQFRPFCVTRGTDPGIHFSPQAVTMVIRPYGPSSPATSAGEGMKTSPLRKSPRASGLMLVTE